MLRIEIKVKGHLDERWSTWFDTFQVSPQKGNETLLSGVLLDQSALYGMLTKLRDLGLSLLEIKVEDV